MADEIDNSIPGERGQATDRRQRDNTLFRRGAIVLAVLAFMGFAFWSMRDRPAANGSSHADHTVIRQTSKFEPAQKKPAPSPAVPPVKLPTPVAKQESPTESDKLLDAARRAPVIAYGAQQGRSSQPPVAPARDDQSSPYVPLAGGQDGFGTAGSANEDRFNRLMRPTRLEGSRAGILGNRDFVIAMGTSIPCVLETAMASDQPGFVSCVINRDVLSDNGRVVLMEKGTQVVGEYRGGLQQGQRRLFVLWNRAKTPKGVIITLASPATDALGRAGVGGYVDTHWWERFGSAMLLSIVGDAADYANNRLENGDIQVQNTTNAGQQAAAVALQQSINIPPTLEKHQGELVSIFVARDLDFSGVYSLRVTEPRNEIYDRAVTGDFRPHSKLVTK